MTHAMSEELVNLMANERRGAGAETFDDDAADSSVFVVGGG